LESEFKRHPQWDGTAHSATTTHPGILAVMYTTAALHALDGDMVRSLG
jgi:hypothetical protein